MYVIIYDCSHYTWVIYRAKSHMARSASEMPVDRDSRSGKDISVSRVERKRRDTRQKIVTAAEKLMTDNPIDEVTIADITHAADIGHGSFYLHFKSKNEVLIPIIQYRAQYWDNVLQRNMTVLDDPAEIIAFSGRHMARVIADDPLWRWFLQHSGAPAEVMREALGRFTSRDFGKGLLTGRFEIPELSIGSGFLLGGFVNSLLTAFNRDNPGKAIDQVMEMILRVLGLPVDEAKLIAHKPLKELEI